MTRREQLAATMDLLGSPIRYFAKSDGRVTGGFCKTVNSLERTINNLRNWDFYVTLNPTRGRAIKARSRDVTHWSRVLIDVDPITPDAIPPYAAGYALAVLDEMLPKSRYAVWAVNSGRGCQLWLNIEPTEIKDREHAAQIERAVAHLLRLLDHRKGGCRIDPSCSDLSRVARCPGTVNQKTKLTASLLYPPVPLTTIPAEDILALAPSQEPIKPLAPTSTHSLARLLPHMGIRVSTFLVEGVGTPGRHAAAYAAASSLRELGVSRERATVLVTRGGRFCRPPLPDSEAARTVRCAFDKEEDQ